MSLKCHICQTESCQIDDIVAGIMSVDCSYCGKYFIDKGFITQLDFLRSVVGENEQKLIYDRLKKYSTKKCFFFSNSDEDLELGQSVTINIFDIINMLNIKVSLINNIDSNYGD